MPGRHDPMLGARVGPNAIIQMAAVLARGPGTDACANVFAHAGLSRYLTEPPEALVDETEAARLFRAVDDAFAPEQAAEIFRQAGRATADYILAHRIPKPAKALLARLPALAARRLLLLAISKHAWTFAGSGAVTCSFGPNLRMDIDRNPLATPEGTWHAAVLHRLFEVLVTSPTRIAYTSLPRNGAVICRFDIGPAYIEPAKGSLFQAASSRQSPIAPRTASAETGRLNR